MPKSSIIEPISTFGPVPEIGQEVRLMRRWTVPSLGVDEQQTATSLSADLFVDYLREFCYGTKVKTLDIPLTWTTWDKMVQPCRQVNLPRYVGLAYGDHCTQIRVRRAPGSAFAVQLNLNDIIGAAIEMSPNNAYALMLLVDHDIHEYEEDNFCYGRAYGRSRVAVLQTARYNTLLNAHENIDYTHMWRMGHCKNFVDELCAVEAGEAPPPTKRQIASSKTGPMRVAVDAAMAKASNSNEAQAALALWLSRLARTISHETGHCFGIGHCVYHACNMQDTASIKEEVRNYHICVPYAMQRLAMRSR